MQVYTAKNDGVREKEQGLRVPKDMDCHHYRSRRGVITDDFFTSYELANFLLTKNMTLIGKLRKNKLEIPALFLNGKPRHVRSFIFACTNDLTLVQYVPARNKILILLLSGHDDDTYMGEGKEQKPEIIMHIMPLKVGMTTGQA
jgi:hypothetical protein